MQRETYLAGEVDLNGLDADVLRAFRHDAVRRTVCGREIKLKKDCCGLIEGERDPEESRWREMESED